jgi:hypothetical protein
MWYGLAVRKRISWDGPSAVTPGFMPGIYVLASKKDVDGRGKPGHDAV